MKTTTSSTSVPAESVTQRHGQRAQRHAQVLGLAAALFATSALPADVFDATGRKVGQLINNEVTIHFATLFQVGVGRSGWRSLSAVGWTNPACGGEPLMFATDDLVPSAAIIDGVVWVPGIEDPLPRRILSATLPAGNCIALDMELELVRAESPAVLTEEFQLPLIAR